MTSIVLAGGRSSRLGRNKLREEVGGRALLDRVLDVVRQVSSELILVVAQGQDPPGRRPDLDLLVKVDIYPGKGALGGIYTGILASGSYHSLVVGADMPFLNASLLRRLMSVSAEFDVVIPSMNGEIEPLHAIYSKRCLEPMRLQIESGNLTIRHFLDQVKVRYVGEEEISDLDPKHLSFFNVNTSSDLRKAEALAGKLDAPGV